MTHASDSVATALADFCAGSEVTYERDGKTETIRLVEAIPFGHKFALLDIAQGSEVKKYGETIGRATAPIKAGAHVHVHNLESLRGRGDLAARCASGKDGGTR